MSVADAGRGLVRRAPLLPLSMCPSNSQTEEGACHNLCPPRRSSLFIINKPTSPHLPTRLRALHLHPRLPARRSLPSNADPHNPRSARRHPVHPRIWPKLRLWPYYPCEHDCPPPPSRQLCDPSSWHHHAGLITSPLCESGARQACASPRERQVRHRQLTLLIRLSARRTLV